MTRYLSVFLVVAGLISTLCRVTRAQENPAAGSVPLDYDLLDHRIEIDYLRAGNHDPDGQNDYTFSVAIFALISSPEEQNLKLPERKHVMQNLGSFGDTLIKPLAIWRLDEKSKDQKQIKIPGQTIRDLIASAMGTLKVAEPDLAVMVEVSMTERNKKLWFFGEDIEVGKVSYFPLPDAKGDPGIRKDGDFTLTDGKGTHVHFNVRYDKPAPVPGT